MPQSFVIRSQRSSLVATQTVCMLATSTDRPIVSGTNRKW